MQVNIPKITILPQHNAGWCNFQFLVGNLQPPLARDRKLKARVTEFLQLFHVLDYNFCILGAIGFQISCKHEKAKIDILGSISQLMLGFLRVVYIIQ